MWVDVDMDGDVDVSVGLSVEVSASVNVENPGSFFCTDDYIVIGGKKFC